MKKLALFLMVSILSVSSLTVFAVTQKTSIYTVSEVLLLVSESFKGEITKIDLETDTSKNIYYEVDILNNGKKTELIVDAKSGKVLKAFEEALDDEEKFITENFLQDKTLKATPSTTQTSPAATPVPSKGSNTTKATITEEAAKKNALDKVGGGKVVKCKLDYDDHTVVYEIEVVYGNYEYEIDIDAYTGSIVSYDKDHIYD